MRDSGRFFEGFGIRVVGTRDSVLKFRGIRDSQISLKWIWIRKISLRNRDSEQIFGGIRDSIQKIRGIRDSLVTFRWIRGSE